MLEKTTTITISYASPLTVLLFPLLKRWTWAHQNETICQIHSHTLLLVLKILFLCKILSILVPQWHLITFPVKNYKRWKTAKRTCSIDIVQVCVCKRTQYMYIWTYFSMCGQERLMYLQFKYKIILLHLSVAGCKTENLSGIVKFQTTHCKSDLQFAFLFWKQRDSQRFGNRNFCKHFSSLEITW